LPEIAWPRNSEQKAKALRAMLALNRLVLQRSIRNHVTRVPIISRYFSSDSHDDFKPKKKERKVIEEGLQEVVGLIDKQVKENPVMLFMKGTPQQPQCGFSLQAVRVLNATGVEFSAVNVLEYPAIREAVKIYSDWPTIPQLYVAGEFVGGCDIMTNMYNDGSLEQLLKDKKVLS
jgi:monothiol glutaredoxin